jgi:hypothetical protein
MQPPYGESQASLFAVPAARQIAPKAELPDERLLLCAGASPPKGGESQAAARPRLSTIRWAINSLRVGSRTCKVKPIEDSFRTAGLGSGKPIWSIDHVITIRTVSRGKNLFPY